MAEKRFAEIRHEAALSIAYLPSPHPRKASEQEEALSRHCPSVAALAAHGFMNIPQNLGG
jgi:hypothetical protein